MNAFLSGFLSGEDVAPNFKEISTYPRSTTRDLPANFEKTAYMYQTPDTLCVYHDGRWPLNQLPTYLLRFPSEKYRRVRNPIN